MPSATYDSLRHLPLATFKILYANAPNNLDYNIYLKTFTPKEQLEIRQCAYAKELADKLAKPLSEYMKWTDFHKNEWTLGKVLEKEREQEQEEQKKKTSFFSFSPPTSHKNDILETLEEIQKDKSDNNTICEKIHKKYPEEISDALTRAVIATLALEKLQTKNITETAGTITHPRAKQWATEIWSQNNPYDPKIQTLREKAAQEAKNALDAFKKLPEAKNALDAFKKLPAAPKQPSFFARLLSRITSFFTKIYNYVRQQKTPEAPNGKESPLSTTFNPLRQDDFHEKKSNTKPQGPQTTRQSASGVTKNRKPP